MTPTEQEYLLRLLLAILLGAVVGAEREYRSKSAGFRTMILISLGSCLFTILSHIVGGPASTDKIASNIATGVGFLGAGVIFLADNRVNGITTAATIWSVAAIGMAAGAGQMRLATGAAMLILFVLSLLPAVQHWIDLYNEGRTYSISTAATEMPGFAEAEMKRLRLRYEALSRVRDGNGILTTIYKVHGRQKAQDTFTASLLADARALRVEC